MELDWLAIFKIVWIDIMLGVDNAIVIALACSTLPAHLRKRAILFGTAGAVALRAILLVFASLLMGLLWIKLIAGAYLLYVGYALLIQHEAGKHNVASASSVFGAIQTIIIADFMMSLDNVLAITAVAQWTGEHGMIYAIAGIALSIPIIIYGATGIVKVMDSYPIIVWIGAGLLGWIGAEMMITDPVAHTILASIEQVLWSATHITIKAAGFTSVLLAAFIMKKYWGHPHKLDEVPSEGV